MEKAAIIDHCDLLPKGLVHQSLQVGCTAGKIDLMPDTDIVLAGPSNYGLHESGENAVVSLYQINVAAILSSMKPSVSNLLILKTMDLLVQDISRAFKEADERFEQTNLEEKTV